MNFEMQVEGRNFFHRVDQNLILIILALNFIGLVNLYSATHGATIDHASRLFWNQIIWIGIGWAIFIGVTLFDYSLLKRVAWFFYALNVGALILTMTVGKVALGAQRWLDLGFFRYQPSETMKIILVITLANLLSKLKKPEGLGYRDLFFPFLIVAIPAGLTIEQPDLGTGLMLLAIFGSMVLFVKVRTSILVFLMVVGLIAAPLIWSFGLKQYQKNRVLTFLAPGKDPRGTGYNSIQSRIAVGSGKVIGKGYLKGTQSQLEFLPERHTDFIFSVLSEEFGFLGSLTTVGLYMILLGLGARAASQARDKFGVLLALGATSVIFWHVFVNICMVIGLLPIVGVPLPLLSYGGSMMITTMACLGIISSVSYRKYLF